MTTPQKPEIIWVCPDRLCQNKIFSRSKETCGCSLSKIPAIAIYDVIEKVEYLKHNYVKYLGTELIHWLQTATNEGGAGSDN